MCLRNYEVFIKTVSLSSLTAVIQKLLSNERWSSVQQYKQGSITYKRGGQTKQK